MEGLSVGLLSDTVRTRQQHQCSPASPTQMSFTQKHCLVAAAQTASPLKGSIYTVWMTSCRKRHFHIPAQGFKPHENISEVHSPAPGEEQEREGPGGGATKLGATLDS